MTKRRPTPLRCALATATAALLATPGVPSPARAAGCAGVQRRGAFTLIAAPSFDDGTDPHGVGPLTRAFASPQLVVGAGGAARLFVTNGVTVLRTTDGGCTWQAAYSLGPTAAPASGSDPQRVVGQADLEHTVRALAARLTPGTSGTDPVLAVLPDSGLSGAVAGAATYGAANVEPFFVARSADGGTTWRTELLQATHPGSATSRVELGEGLSRPVNVALSPADPRTAYLLAGAQCLEQGPGPADVLRYGCLYVTRDGGATWAFAATNKVGPRAATDAPLIVADPLDSRLVYAVQNGSATVDAITVGTTVKRRALGTLPANLTPIGLDVVHVRGRAAQLVVTESYPGTAPGTYGYVIHRSLDGGAHWEKIGFPSAGVTDGFAGSAAWLSANGDVVGVRTVHNVAVLERWDARHRAWRKPVVLPAPLAGAEGMVARSFQPADPGHRRFAFSGTQPGPAGPVTALGLYDTAAR
jgi:hypothetical protein